MSPNRTTPSEKLGSDCKAVRSVPAPFHLLVPYTSTSLPLLGQSRPVLPLAAFLTIGVIKLYYVRAFL